MKKAYELIHSIFGLIGSCGLHDYPGKDEYNQHLIDIKLINFAFLYLYLKARILNQHIQG
ncbi:MAG TPA: hypothetical protein P5050_08150 [Bacteroidia bacterium]|nr:hypothetical protein [Bacteroidia bacterium]HRS59176.1 hypothetical protein [Bacteroidia bacterium]HRU67224.1 hypothetical protein [Bacteroidia bacterium]